MSLIPHLFWFLFGAIMYVNWNLIKKFIEGRFLYYFIPYLCLLIFNDSFPKVGIHPEMHIRSVIGFFMNIMLSVMTISAAFSFKSASKILKGHDLSYGIYLYHGLVINIWMEFSDYRSMWLYLLIYIITMGCAWLSWRYIEKPSLSLKNVF